jgi:Coenzyme PQQ synthesis protein D (PqqD)
MIASDTLIRPNPRVVHRELADEAGGVLLHLDTGAYHGLSATGALIWKLLGEGKTFGTLMAEFTAEVDDAPPEAESEVAQFLEELRERDLVIVGSSGDA